MKKRTTLTLHKMVLERPSCSRGGSKRKRRKWEASCCTTIDTDVQAIQLWNNYRYPVFLGQRRGRLRGVAERPGRAGGTWGGERHGTLLIEISGWTRLLSKFKKLIILLIKFKIKNDFCSHRNIWGTTGMIQSWTKRSVFWGTTSWTRAT